MSDKLVTEMCVDPSTAHGHGGYHKTDIVPSTAPGHGGDQDMDTAPHTPQGHHGGDHETNIVPDKTHRLDGDTNPSHTSHRLDNGIISWRTAYRLDSNIVPSHWGSSCCTGGSSRCTSCFHFHLNRLSASLGRALHCPPSTAMVCIRRLGPCVCIGAVRP